MSSEQKTFDLTGAIIDYEAGVMNWDEEVALFQHLINTGMAWSLQGSYGRHAAYLISTGDCTPPTQGAV